jgi:hypothetical protein
MVVKLRLREGPDVRPGRTKNRRLAWAAASLLTPAALGAWLMAIWKLASDLKLAGPFGFGRGPLSHWQLWAALAALLTAAAVKLNRYGRPTRKV